MVAVAVTAVMLGGGALVTGAGPASPVFAQSAGTMTLSATPNPVTTGANFTVTFTVAPPATGLTSVGFSVPVPAGVTYVSCTPDANCNLVGSNVIFGAFSGNPVLTNQVFTATFTAGAPGQVTFNPTGNECIGADGATDVGCPDEPLNVTIQAQATTVTSTATTVTTTPTTVTTTPTTVTTTPTTVVPTTVVPPSPGVIRFAQSTSSVSEANPGGKTVTVRRVGGSAGEVTAICTITVLGTATSGLDFTGTVDQTITFGDGDAANKSCTYELLGDVLVEGSETIIFALSDGDSNQSLRAEIGSPSTHTVTIEDNDEVVNPNTPTPTKTPPVYGSPVVSTSTPYPTSTPTVTNTPKPTQSAVPTNTSSAQTHTPTATPTKPASTTVTSTATGGTGGTGGSATPRPPSAGTGSDFGGSSTLAALLLVAIGLAVSGFAATRVTRK